MHAKRPLLFSGCRMPVAKSKHHKALPKARILNYTKAGIIMNETLILARAVD